MTTRVARAIVLSVGIAVFITAIYFWLMNETRFKPGKTKPEGYSGQLSFHIGSSSGALLSDQAVRQARAILEGRLKKMNWDYALKAAPDNRFELSVDKMQDGQSVVELLSGSGYLEMLEVYRLGDMPGVGEGLQASENGIAPFTGLFKLMSPAAPYKANVASVFPAYIGITKPADTAEVRRLLEAPSLKPYWPADAHFLFGELDSFNGSGKMIAVYAVKNTVPRLTNQYIVNASAGYSPDGRSVEVMFNFDAYGTVEWERLTARNINRSIAICLNNKVISAPTVNQSIHGGRSVILFGPQVGLEYCRVMAILLTSTNLTQPVQVLHTSFTPIHSGPSPPVKYALMFLLSFSMALGIHLLIFRLSKI